MTLSFLFERLVNWNEHQRCGKKKRDDGTAINGASIDNDQITKGHPQ